MRRFILLLLCASGCDLVFALPEPEPGACGPFDEPTPVPFSATLPKLTQFSANGTRGLARTTENPARLIALIFDGTEWVGDPTYQANLDMLRTTERLHFGVLSFEDRLFGALRPQNDPSYKVYEYGFTNHRGRSSTTSRSRSRAGSRCCRAAR